MEKQKTKKLKVNKDTIRLLSEAALGTQVRGGAGTADPLFYITEPRA